jgi:hypothetical protein
MTTPTLNQIMHAVATAAPSESAEVKGQMIANIIASYHAEITAHNDLIQTATKQRDTKPVRMTQDWRNSTPSAVQMARIERAEEAILAYGKALGIRRVLRGEARSTALATAGAASTYYKNLAAYTKPRNIRF